MSVEIPRDLAHAFRQEDGNLLARSVEHRVVTRRDPDYPGTLNDLPDAPEMLWIAGRPLHELPPGVAVVGARKANGYGLGVARRLGADLAAAGVTVYSGMAYGADAAAHDGALSAGGPTVAVLGCGVDVCYPAVNARLYLQIARAGTIVSEFEPGTRPRKGTLAGRNRIIAALSMGVVVVQAANDQSGALKTARIAETLGRQVFGVPGLVDWPLSREVHRLIVDSRARLCAGADDVVTILKNELQWRAVDDRPVPAHLSMEEQAVLGVLAQGPASLESVCARSGLDARGTFRAVAALELEGFIGRATGGVLRRVR